LYSVMETSTVMKTKLVLLALVTALTSCDIMVVEPVYDYRDRITGSYRLEEHSHTYHDVTRFNIYIRKYGIYDEGIIENFYNSGVDVRANITYDKIYIARQLVNGYEIEGIGTFYGEEIRFSYTVRDIYSYNKPIDYCDAVAWFR